MHGIWAAFCTTGNYEIFSTSCASAAVLATTSTLRAMSLRIACTQAALLCRFEQRKGTQSHHATAETGGRAPPTTLRNPEASITEVNPLGVRQGLNLPVGQSNASGMLNISIAPQLIWLFGDTIKKVFLAKVDAMDYVPGLPLTERTSRHEQLTTQLPHTGGKEELICEAELANLPIYRRADADPAVVLAYDPDGDMGAQGARMVSLSSSAPTSNPAAP